MSDIFQLMRNREADLEKQKEEEKLKLTSEASDKSDNTDTPVSSDNQIQDKHENLLD